MQSPCTKQSTKPPQQPLAARARAHPGPHPEPHPEEARNAGADQRAVHHKGSLTGSDQRESGFAMETEGRRPARRDRRVGETGRPREATCERLWSNAQRKNNPRRGAAFRSAEARAGSAGGYEAPPGRGSLPRRASRTMTASAKVPRAPPLPDHPGEAEGPASARCSCGNVSDRHSDRATRGTSHATQRFRRIERRTMGVVTRTTHATQRFRRIERRTMSVVTRTTTAPRNQ